MLFIEQKSGNCFGTQCGLRCKRKGSTLVTFVDGVRLGVAIEDELQVVRLVRFVAAFVNRFFLKKLKL